MAKKIDIFHVTPQKVILWPLKLSYGLWMNQMHPMNFAKHKCKHVLFIEKNWGQLNYLIHSFWFLIYNIVVNTIKTIVLEDSKGHW
jgi:hypothetical protein